jgi:D-sedoheptulose 7-phosphate isomerase
LSELSFLPENLQTQYCEEFMPASSDRASVFDQAIAEHVRVIQTIHAQRPILERIAGEMTNALLAGHKVLWCGNGGSAADSQHLSAELVGRFRRNRRGLASIALTTDTSALTAIGNDFGYEEVFRRQVEALCNQGDVVVGLSTSGNSKNVCLALELARELGAFTVAFTGQGGGAMAGMAHAALCIASKDTARIQEGHILCGHMLCDWVELSACAPAPAEKEALSR